MTQGVYERKNNQLPYFEEAVVFDEDEDDDYDDENEIEVIYNNVEPYIEESISEEYDTT